ncbi:hypothetical protein NKH13_34910 [Mesorhizobium sp. M1348]
MERAVRAEIAAGKPAETFIVRAPWLYDPADRQGAPLQDGQRRTSF